jgi:hypothetical protein
MKHISIAAAISLGLLVFSGCGTESSASRGGSRLALTEPVDQSMLQGQSNRVAVAIARTGFADAIRVTFSNLPQGVRVDGDTIPAGDSSRDFVMIAAPDARVVNRHIVTVQAQGAGITTSQTFELTVGPRV